MPVIRSAIPRWAGALGAALVLAAPRIALACPVCFSGRDDETQLAFRVSTAVMTLLPFFLVGGLLWWLRRRFRALAEQEERLTVEGTAGQPIIR